MWTFDVHHVIQNNSYMQLSAKLCVFEPLLRDLRQTSPERFVKPAVARVIALSRHCFNAAMGTVSSVPLSGYSGLCSSTDFGNAISASLDLVGFEDACRIPLFRGQLGVLLLVALASQRRQRV